MGNCYLHSIYIYTRIYKTILRNILVIEIATCSIKYKELFTDSSLTRECTVCIIYVKATIASLSFLYFIIN